MLNGSQERIVVIDGNPDTRAMLVNWIESNGLNCQSAASAEIYLDRLHACAPGCLIVDDRLPSLSVLELLERLTGRPAAPQVIVVSSVPTVSLTVKLMRGGAFTVIQKPYSPQMLWDAIRGALSEFHRLKSSLDQLQNWKRRLSSLTPAELQVAQGIASGTPNQLLASQLNIGLRTVEKRRQRVFRKLEVDTLPALIELIFHTQPELLESPLPESEDSPETSNGEGEGDADSDGGNDQGKAPGQPGNEHDNDNRNDNKNDNENGPLHD